MKYWLSGQCEELITAQFATLGELWSEVQHPARGHSLLVFLRAYCWHQSCLTSSRVTLVMMGQTALHCKFEDNTKAERVVDLLETNKLKKLAICPYDISQHHPSLQEQKHCQQIEGGNLYPLFTTGERRLEYWGSVLGSPAEKKETCWSETHKDDDEGIGMSETQEAADRAPTTQL